MNPAGEHSFDDLRARLGQEVGVSRWFVIDQARIDAFADLTEDHQYIHVDPERAAATPFGTTIAHGFLTLSMLSAMAYDAQPRLANLRMGVNYGFERVRFVSPVPVGARIRGRFVLDALEERAPDEVQLTYGVTVEVEGREKPALVAVWLGRRYLEAA
ncbi:nodulation protein NodN [Defluviimonas sp. 20V17]|uniref:Acyl dehydratase n=1 Tax=Allgaiera indica TaxID=765699 RepID=A0AAN5A0Q9_9RHOB|nr:MaoC family dehydratase [Allgaiera indica]KDB05227.1 nodulation protein NodN [Defluviimonas sp. 20V17]GHE04972.1 nodulation protein NodN [Allgaiera indica]SDX60453.1 Acyl dehydratase [Allgaiera indica]